MQPKRLVVMVAGLAAALAMSPVIGAVALAADPAVVVVPGDTLTGISRQHGVPIERIVQLNHLVNPDRIYPGQRLLLAAPEPVPKPALAATPARAAAPATAAPPLAPRIHLVQRGENLTVIARRYEVTVAAIVAANAIANPSRILAGQRLQIPGAAPEPAPKPANAATPARAAAPATAAPPPAPRIHLVQRGENLTVIARRYEVTVAAIVAANAIANPSRILAGQRLQIPGAAPEPAPVKPAGMSAAMSRLVAARGSVRDLIVTEARRYGVPVALALAVAWQESGWRQEVVSSAGAIGVMQLLPSTADWVGASMLGERVDAHDVGHNVRAGVCLLAHYLGRYGGSVDLALAAYYQGQTAADRHGVYRVTRPYIASVRLLMAVFGG